MESLQIREYRLPYNSGAKNTTVHFKPPLLFIQLLVPLLPTLQVPVLHDFNYIYITFHRISIIYIFFVMTMVSSYYAFDYGFSSNAEFRSFSRFRLFLCRVHTATRSQRIWFTQDLIRPFHNNINSMFHVIQPRRHIVTQSLLCRQY